MQRLIYQRNLDLFHQKGMEITLLTDFFISVFLYHNQHLHVFSRTISTSVDSRHTYKDRHVQVV